MIHLYLETNKAVSLQERMYAGFKLIRLAQTLLPFVQDSAVIVGSHNTLVGGNKSS